MNVGALTMPGLGGYGYLQELLQKPQYRSFESFLNPRAQREPSTSVLQPLSSSSDTGNLVRYANPFRSDAARAASETYSLNSTGVGMEAGALTLTRQSTEMRIRTRDGDLVAIHISEKKGTAAYLSAKQDTGKADDKAHTVGLDYQNTRAQASTFDLKAVFQGNEVSDVSIQAESASLEQTSLHVQSQDKGGQTDLEYRSVTATSSSFSFQVEGSLDQEELEAIGSLLEDVDALATEFFDGDVQVAFQKASQLGYDDSEIAGYAFNMVEQETSIVAERYLGDTGDTGLPASVSRPIVGYMERLQRIQDTANLYFEMKVLEVMMDRIAGTRERDTHDEKQGVEASERFRAFNERILNAMLEWVDS